MTNYKNLFSDYILNSNVTDSGKATSYVRALDHLSEMIKSKPFDFNDCEDIWIVTSVERLQELYQFVLNESRKKDSSPWNINGIPKSYLQNGFCSAALKIYQKYLMEYNFEMKILDVLDSNINEETKLEDKLDIDLDYPNYLMDETDDQLGEDVLRTVRTRANQNVFRKIVLRIYDQSCCITGLDIPELNIASHIIPWAEDETKRLDPRNGLCLSATYDAAFDRNLISLDDDYRIIISKDITDQYTNESVKYYFISKEGEKIKLPSSYLPHKDCLAEHRSKGNF